MVQLGHVLAQRTARQQQQKQQQEQPSQELSPSSADTGTPADASASTANGFRAHRDCAEDRAPAAGTSDPAPESDACALEGELVTDEELAVVAECLCRCRTALDEVSRWEHHQQLCDVLQCRMVKPLSSVFAWDSLCA